MEKRAPSGPKFNDALAGFGLLVLRVGAGGSMAVYHGAPKLQQLVAGDIYPLNPLGLGPELTLLLLTIAELGCAGLVVIGLLCRLSCLPLIVAMLVAAFAVPSDHPLADQELALLYAAAFGTLFFTGPGYWSLDHHPPRAE